MKKILSLVLALALSFTLAMGACATVTFSDVESDDWAYEYINYAASEGVVNGVGGGKFDPDGMVTVAQFTKIITAAFYSDEIKKSAADDTWYAPYIAVANEHEILYKISEKDINQPSTRYQMARIIYNTMEDLGIAMLTSDNEKTVLSKIPDKDEIPLEYASAVANVYNLGIINGIDELGTFGGSENMTREQATVVYYRMEQVILSYRNSWSTATYTTQQNIGNDDTHQKTLSSDNGLSSASIDGDDETHGETQLTVAGETYTLGMTENELVALAGYADDKLETFAGYKWYVYGTETYEDFFMAGVYDSTVVALCSSGVSFSYMGIKAGDTVTEDGQINQYGYIFADDNDNLAVHTVMLTDKTNPVFSSSFEVTDDRLSGEAMAVFYLTNAFRHLHGVATLQWSNKSEKSSLLHSQEMAEKNYFSHNSFDGSEFPTRFVAQGIYYKTAGENIAAGQRSGVLVYNAWVDSASHRTNMLREEFTHIGIGIAYNSNARYKYYYTQDFYS